MVVDGTEFDVLRTVIGISVLVLTARIFAGILSRFRVPEVIGEILAGVTLGPFALGGAIVVFGQPIIQENSLFLAFATIGGIVVLLYAGLEFTLKDLVKSGVPALVIATAGVLLPFFLGYYAAIIFGLGIEAAMIVGATLTATSLAVTVSVLRELRKHDTVEAKMMVSAAVIDDILGLIVLSVIIAIVQSHKAPSIYSIATTTVLAFFIWGASVIFAVLTIPRILRLLGRARAEGTIEAGMTGITFGIAAFVGAFGLSPIIGAFIAGMGASESRYKEGIREFVAQLRLIFGPLFFAVIGTYLDLWRLSFTDVWLILTLVVVAIVAKYIGCGVPATFFLKDPKKGSRVGYGMISRGEVGFIVIGIALTSQVISQSVYSELLLTLIITTLISPILLRRAYADDNIA